MFIILTTFCFKSTQLGKSLLKEAIESGARKIGILALKTSSLMGKGLFCEWVSHGELKSRERGAVLSHYLCEQSALMAYAS